MSKRGGDAVLKRAREKTRLEKQDAKRIKRQARSEDEKTLSSDRTDALMEEFARLSAQYEASQVSGERFNTERDRIFTALGIASADD
jgi:hypothetical protein